MLLVKNGHESLLSFKEEEEKQNKTKRNKQTKNVFQNRLPTPSQLTCAHVPHHPYTPYTRDLCKT